MSELSRLVKDLHLRDNGDQRSNSRGTIEEVLLGDAMRPGTQRLLLDRTSVGKLSSQCSPFGHASSTDLDLWDISHIESLQQNILDPTSHILPYPPLDLDTRIATWANFQREKSNCVPQRVVFPKDKIIRSSSAKLTGIHFFLVHLSACCEYESTDSTQEHNFCQV